MSKQITCNDEQLQVLIDHEQGLLDLSGPPTTVEESKTVTKSLKFIANCKSGMGQIRRPRTQTAETVAAETLPGPDPGQDVSQG